MFPLQERKTAHSTYTTALALEALLELRASGLPWNGSERLRDELINSTVRWLLSQFDPAGAGWRADPISTKLNQ
jgi:hypothetical protein